MIDNKYIESLSPVQYKAATEYSGATLVIAGAGSGKTRVLTARIAYMLSQGVSPSSIIALTFTNKAAREMKERITTVVNSSQARGLWMGTFHSLFSRILRAESEHIGFPNSFTIYETADSRNLVKSIIKEMNLNDEKYKPKEIFSRISLMKNALTTPAIYANQSSLISEDMQAGRGEFAAIYRAYMAKCKQNGAMDFDDLLLYTNILFKNCPDVLRKYQEQFQYILVDEYQDTNYSQYLIVKKLAELNGNVCVVGDDAQSIYSFRGAKIENILRFQKDYPDAVVHKLEQNYRSTQNIVGAANSIIALNTNQLKKRVFSEKEEGDLLALIRSESDREEAATIARDIDRKYRSGVSYNDIAILYRANSQSRAFEDQLRNRNIPYRIYGGTSFYQRAEIKDIIAYVRLIVNRSDDEALKRVINFPARGIGKTTIDKIEARAKEQGITLWDVVTTSTPSDLGINGGTATRIGNFTTLIKHYQSLKDSVSIYDLVYDLVVKSGIVALYKNNPVPESLSALENVEELINSLKIQCEASQKEEEILLIADNWIQEVTLLTDMDEKSEEGAPKQEVKLMTIHASKGLEFDSIYIVGVEEGNFPSQRSVEDLSSLEEERRLFYVALTRAVNTLTLSFATTRYKWGTSSPSSPSRFLKEIDKNYLDSPDLLSEGRFLNDAPSANEPKTGSYKPNNRQGEGQSVKKYQPRPGSLKKLQNSTNSNVVVDISTLEYAVGDKVLHDRFGAGVIEGIEPFADDVKFTINFENHGTKVLLRKFAKLERVE